MSMDFEFTKIKDAKAFVRALKQRFAVYGCEVEADVPAELPHRIGPYVRVPRQFPWDDDTGGKKGIMKRFKLTSRDIDKWIAKQDQESEARMREYFDNPTISQTKKKEMAEQNQRYRDARTAEDFQTERQVALAVLAEEAVVQVGKDCGGIFAGT